MTPEIFITDPSWPYSKAKTAVLTAASAVIREDGPRAATLKNIATRAGITEPAIFRHFEGVDGLFDGLFSAYERVYERSAKAFTVEGKGLSKLKEASLTLVENIAASHDFAYVLLFARHIFRGYPELKARVTANDAKDQAAVLACVNEGIKAGDIRSDIDPVSTASSLIGAIYVTAVLWIESGFGFDLKATFADRWDDFERMVAAKPSPKSREGKSASRERALSYFPLRPPVVPKTRGSGSKKAVTKAAPARKSKDAAKPSKAAKLEPKAPGRVTAKAPAKAQAKSAAKKAAPAKKPGPKSR